MLNNANFVPIFQDVVNYISTCPGAPLHFLVRTSLPPILQLHSDGEDTDKSLEELGFVGEQLLYVREIDLGAVDIEKEVFFGPQSVRICLETFKTDGL